MSDHGYPCRVSPAVLSDTQCTSELINSLAICRGGTGGITACPLVEQVYVVKHVCTQQAHV